MITGDCNLPDVNWLSLIGNNPSSSLFCDLFHELNVTWIVDRPTHLKANTLDVILTNACDAVHDLKVHPHNSTIINSDHYLVSFTISSVHQQYTRSKPNHVYDFPKADMEGLCSYLLDADYGQVFNLPT